MNIKKNIKNINITGKIKKIKNNRNIFIFMIFFLIATILWFLSTLNKEYTTKVEVPVRYNNIPNKNNLISKLSLALEVEIKGYGYNILQIKLDRFAIPVIINIDEQSFVKTSYNPEKYYILGDDLKDIVSRRIGKNIELVGIKPDSIFFDYSKRVSKKVPVRKKLSYKLPKGYMLTNKISVKPDSVLLYGNQKDLDNFSEIETADINLGRVNPDKTYKLNLRIPENIDLNVKYVEIKIPADKFINKKLRKSITPIGFPDNFNEILVPDNVEVKFNIPISYINSFSQNQIEVFADYNNRKNNQIKIEVETQIRYLENIRVQPKFTHFLLERKND